MSTLDPDLKGSCMLLITSMVCNREEVQDRGYVRRLHERHPSIGTIESVMADGRQYPIR